MLFMLLHITVYELQADSTDIQLNWFITLDMIRLILKQISYDF